MFYDKHGLTSKNIVMTREFTNEDCMELMARYPDKHFDLAIVDPPYGIRQDGAKNKTRGKAAKAKDYKPFAGNDLSAPDDLYFNELFRVSKNQIIWGANHFLGKTGPAWIVWDKLNSGDFADCELAWTSFKTAVRKFEFRWNGMIQGNMKHKEDRIHPTQKPVALYKWLLTNYAKPGDLILDTHVGSASSLIACEEIGFEYVACELDPDYFAAANKRLNTYRSQLKIF